jgi:hypothetical protein
MSLWVIQRHAEVSARCLFLPIADIGCGLLTAFAALALLAVRAMKGHHAVWRSG